MKRKIHFLTLSGIVRLPLKQFLVLLMIEASVGLKAQNSVPVLTIDKHQIVITHQGQKLSVSLDCPSFILENQIVGGYSPLRKYGDIRKSEKEPFHVSYAPVNLKGGGQMEIQLFIQWSPTEKLLRKWAKYRLSDTESHVLLKEVILDRLEAKDSTISLPTVPGQSYPVFLDGFFAGIEYPVSSMRKESGQIVIAHQPGLKIQAGKWYESRKAVYCATPKGHEKESFLSYISAHRPGNNEMHVNYNSWWSSPVPYSEKEILELMKTFEEKLFIPYGVSFNTFCIDLGWSDPKSIWGIDTLLFPQRFINIQEAARKMNTNLGLWVSPSNMYSPKSLDSDWAEQHGYETFVIDSTKKAGRLCCLAGKHYSSEFRKQLVDMVSKYEIKQLKFDGFIFTPTPALLCNESDHGHEPGYLSIEPTAEALIETCRQIHTVSPDTWIETTCMGGDPSPWWLFYVNSVIGTFGGDYPEGRIPCPVYRESYTSSRDYFNIQGATYGLAPIFSQEMLGVAHQTMEPFLNDAVTAIMRGNSFLPLYINPVYMDGTRWRMTAEMITWAKNNVSLIKNTKVLLPESWQNGKVPRFKQDPSAMPREPYGYAHCGDDRALIELRNPWIKNSEYLLKIDRSTGFSENVKNLNIVSIYPEVRIYASGLQYGDTVNIPLAPYETLVLSLSDHESLNGLPNAADLLRGFGRIEIRKIGKTVIHPAKINNSAIMDSVIQRQATTSVVRFNMEGSVEVKSPQADLLVLIEGDNIPIKQEGTININGNLMPFITTENRRILPRWKASKKYWVFLEAPMKQGENLISLKLDLPETPLNVSVWTWAKKPGNTALESYPNALPQPEDLSIESVNLVESFNTETIYHKSAIQPPTDADGRPIIVKTGIIDCDMVETTPVVFKNKVYRFEYVRPKYWNNPTGDSYFRFVDRETGKTTKPFAKGFHLGSAFVDHGTVYVTAVDKCDGERIYLFSSKDLENWDSWLAIELPGYGLFNTSLTRAGNKFVLMFEIGKPKEVAGVRFTALFATSTDLKKWEVLSPDHNYAKDHFTAPHCLRYLDGYYYDFYVAIHNGYETMVVRSKDLINWMPSPLNPVMKASEEDRKIANKNMSEKMVQRIANAEDCNNSDIDFCEFNGRLIINYSWGNQRGEEFLAEAYYEGTLEQFLRGWFPN